MNFIDGSVVAEGVKHGAVAKAAAYSYIEPVRDAVIRIHHGPGLRHLR